MTTTQTLAAFLLARIEEDEAVARAVNTGRWYPWDDRNGELYFASKGLNARARVHLHRWGPARVLAECEAKRATIAEALALDDQPAGVGLRVALRFMASVWQDHPDYATSGVPRRPEEKEEDR